MFSLLILLTLSTANATPLEQLRSQCQDHPGDTWLGLYQFAAEALTTPDGTRASAELVKRYAPYSDILVLGRSTDEYYAYRASADGQYQGTGRKALSHWYRDTSPRVDAYLYGSALTETSSEMRYGFSTEGKLQFMITNYPSEQSLYSAPLTVRHCADLWP